MEAFPINILNDLLDMVQNGSSLRSTAAFLRNDFATIKEMKAART